MCFNHDHEQWNIDSVEGRTQKVKKELGDKLLELAEKNREHHFTRGAPYFCTICVRHVCMINPELSSGIAETSTRCDTSLEPTEHARKRLKADISADKSTQTCINLDILQDKSIQTCGVVINLENISESLKSLSTDQLNTLAYALGQQQKSVIRDDSLNLTTMRDLPTLMDIDLKQYLSEETLDW